jgi:hypothetical protein
VNATFVASYWLSIPNHSPRGTTMTATGTSQAPLHSRTGPPQVVGLFTAVAAGEPMRTHASVEVAAGIGILGDRYATRLGHWSDPRWRDQQLTLVGVELLDELGLAPDALRRNIVTRGIDLHDLIGLEFGIGDAVMRGKRICTPCAYIGRLNDRPGLLAELQGRGGIRVSVVRGGVIRLGDPIEILGLGDPLAED